MLWATIVSIILIGGAISSLLGGWIADRFGRLLHTISQIIIFLVIKCFAFFIYRKRCLLASAILYLLGSSCSLFCVALNSIGLLLFGRLLLGFACGLSTSTAPMYLCEVAPLNLRGSVAVCYTLGLAMGVFIGTACSMEEVLGTHDLWQYSLTAFALFVVISLVFYPWLPESPKYLYIIACKRDKAKKGRRKCGSRAT